MKRDSKTIIDDKFFYDKSKFINFDSVENLRISNHVSEDSLQKKYARDCIDCDDKPVSIHSSLDSIESADDKID